jgi:hypothetical protein
VKHYAVCRHTTAPFYTCMLMIAEGDPAPTMDEIDEGERLQEALCAGDPNVELVVWDERPGCLLAFWKNTETAAA